MKDGKESSARKSDKIYTVEDCIEKIGLLSEGQRVELWEELVKKGIIKEN